MANNREETQKSKPEPNKESVLRALAKVDSEPWSINKLWELGKFKEIIAEN